MELEVPGVKPRGRPKKQWKNNVEEDLREMNLTEADASTMEKKTLNGETKKVSKSG